MRKQINGLSIMVSEVMKMDPFEGHLFLFCNKSKRRLKALYWDRNGFCLWMKRLEKDKFPWPGKDDEAKEITEGELAMLLSGIDFFRAHKELKYSSTT
jgi:transposase